MDQGEQPGNVHDELTKLVINRFPNITYKVCVAFVQELELELPRLRDLQIEEDKSKE